MENEQSAFWLMVAKKYDQTIDKQFGGRTRALVAERVASEHSLGDLVEFGCGTGYYTRILAGKARSVIATDVSPGMLTIAANKVSASNLSFALQDCQKTNLPTGAFDAAFLSLVLHFTEPSRTLAEMHRVLKPGGTLIISNLGASALTGLDKLRARMRVLYYGMTRYRIKPPKGFGQTVLTEKQLHDQLSACGFELLSSATIKDASRSSSIPIAYVKAKKIA